MSDFADDRHCFVCGPENGSDLRLVFRRDGEAMASETEVTFPAHLQGWRGAVHGGLLATVLDEAMVQAGMAGGFKCVTAEISVKFRKPAATGDALRITARIAGVRGRILQAEGTVRDGTGQILTEATAILCKVS